MRQMFQAIRAHRTEDLVLVTVIASSGATPRGAGARMLVSERGILRGTIGGGGVEHRSEAIAKEVLRSKASLGHDFSLTKDDVQKLGMICGGAVEVFFHYIPANDPHTLAVAAEAETLFAAGKAFWLISDLAAGGRLSLTEEPHGRHPQRTADRYIEQIGDAGRVYVFGGGHVAQELVPVLSHVGFRCVVMDDRPEFADSRLFPQAEAVILGDFQRISDYLSIDSDDYVCVMTRGHASDTVVQAQVLRRRPTYCGVIGSAMKAAGVRKSLKEDYGLTDEELSRITTPIGLPIQAETPAEIAISIAAQMILHRAQN